MSSNRNLIVVRCAQRNVQANGKWSVNTWVKQGILLGFRMGRLVDMTSAPPLRFFDKDTYPTRPTTTSDNVRIVPGGSSIRDGAYVAPGVVCMPPMYVNVGAYVDEGTMIDSHALVGSCAQIGKRVHLSAAAQDWRRARTNRRGARSYRRRRAWSAAAVGFMKERSCANERCWRREQS